MSPEAVTMFNAYGRTRVEECVSVRAPVNRSVISRPSQELVEPIAVMVVVPVTLKLEAVEAGVMVEAEAMSLPAVTV
jgi:hypothetical protein